MTKEEVVQLVGEQLCNHTPGSVRLNVCDELVWRGEYCWYVGVLPSREPSDPYAVYEALADVEETLAEKQQIEVLFRLVDPIIADAHEPGPSGEMNVLAGQQKASRPGQPPCG